MEILRFLEWIRTSFMDTLMSLNQVVFCVSERSVLNETNTIPV